MKIMFSFMVYLTLLFNIEFTISEGKQYNENYIIFDKRSAAENDQIRSSDEIQRRAINPSLAETPIEQVNPLTKTDFVLDRKNSSIGGANDTSPEVTTQSESNSTANGITTAVPITDQSSPDTVQPTSESTQKEQITTEINTTDKISTESDITSDKNPTSKTPVPSGPTSSAPPSLTGFIDATTFKGGMNHWDFEGEWGKYDLRTLKEEEKPVPELQTSADNVIFMSKMAAPVLLRKGFPPLLNATITLTFYLKTTTQGTMEMQGFLSNSEGEKMIFHLTKQELFEHNHLWCTNKYILGSYHEPFEVIIRLRSQFRSVWAADAITIRGWKLSDQGELANYTVPQTSSSTQSSKLVTTTDEISTNNITTTSNNYDPNNSTEKSGSYDELNGGDNSSSPESWKDLAHIATAIWDAFYVFLALFCACLIALIILIVKQRCRDDPMPPAMATYSPRMSTYQIGKPRDNPSYETDSV